jgi:hypothetical protein
MEVVLSRDIDSPQHLESTRRVCTLGDSRKGIWLPIMNVPRAFNVRGTFGLCKAPARSFERLHAGSSGGMRARAGACARQPERALGGSGEIVGDSRAQT